MTPGTSPAILVLSGWRAWPFLSRVLARELRKRLGMPPGDPAILPMSFQDCSTISACVERAVTRCHAHFGPDAPLQIVAVSMGGLIARKAILDGHHGARLRATRLFTLATPHRGASLARYVRLDSAARDMKPGSDFLRDLNTRDTAATRPYELVCYARLGDMWVGSTNAAPPGMDPIWVSWQPLSPSHLAISRDTRIIDDIAARIMGKEPLLKPNGPPPRD